MNHEVWCLRCGGTGYLAVRSGDDDVQCPSCGGSGDNPILSMMHETQDRINAIPFDITPKRKDHWYKGEGIMYYVIFESQYGEFTRTKFSSASGAYSFWKYMRGWLWQSNWKRIYIATMS